MLCNVLFQMHKAFAALHDDRRLWGPGVPPRVVPLLSFTLANLGPRSQSQAPQKGCFQSGAWWTAAAKSCQSCLTLRPHRRQPTRLCRPWDSPGKNTGVGCHFLLQCMKVKSESELAQSCPTLSDLWTAAFQASLFMWFSRQEYWSGLPLPSPTQGLGAANLFEI